MLVVHNWLKDYIGESIPSAEDIEKLLTFPSFEIEGVDEALAREAFALASAKLPFDTTFVKRTVM